MPDPTVNVGVAVIRPRPATVAAHGALTAAGQVDRLLGARLLAASRLARYEQQVAAAVRRALDTHKARTLTQLRATVLTASSPPDPFDIPGWDTTVAEEVSPVIEDILAKLADGAVKFLSLTPAQRNEILGAIDIPTVAASFVDRITGMGTAVAGRLEDSLSEGVQLGESVDKLTARVDRIFGQGASSAETIARSETHSAAELTTFSTTRAVAAAGFTVSKTWLSTSDSRTRPDHVDADGQTVGLDDAFDVGGEALMFPGDPDGSPENTANCRCSVAYEAVDAEGNDVGPADVGDEGDGEDG